MPDSATETTLNINIDSLNASFVDGLKKQFGSVDLEIHIHKRPENWLTEAGFWGIIDSFDWSQPDDDQAVLKPAVDKLATMPLPTSISFKIFFQKSYGCSTLSNMLKYLWINTPRGGFQ